MPYKNPPSGGKKKAAAKKPGAKGSPVRYLRNPNWDAAMRGTKKARGGGNFKRK